MMARPKNPTVAIVCAWRKGEDDLQATIDSATASCIKGAKVITVEDKEAQGPGRTRHRGIEAAKDADVIIIVDAHMRFRGDALATMAKHAARHGLCCARTYHNETCGFIGIPYAGARIVYKARDGKTNTALAGKWARTNKAGPVGCIMGGCYAFRRDWYYQIGQPLSMLTGWGCDEEALSIASWLSGQMPTCLDVEVAHRYRHSPPWPVASSEYAAVRLSRMALIEAVSADNAARVELQSWQRTGVYEGIAFSTSKEIERFKAALLKLTRKWAEWRKEVCEPEELDGVQGTLFTTGQRKMPERNIIVTSPGVNCPNPTCRELHDVKKLKVEDTYPYPNGNVRRRHLCTKCGKPFHTMFYKTTGRVS